MIDGLKEVEKATIRISIDLNVNGQTSNLSFSQDIEGDSLILGGLLMRAIEQSARRKISSFNTKWKTFEEIFNFFK